jgi:hypothetical protein
MPSRRLAVVPVAVAVVAAGLGESPANHVSGGDDGDVQLHCVELGRNPGA